MTPAMVQFEGFCKHMPISPFNALACATRLNVDCFLPTAMAFQTPRIASCLATTFAPSLRRQAQRSTLPSLRRTFATTTEQPRLRLGSVAPNFKAKTTQGDIDFHEWLGDKWGILFSHPADFTPVCTTELGAFAKMKAEFEKRHVKMIGLVRLALGFVRKEHRTLTRFVSQRTTSDPMTVG